MCRERRSRGLGSFLVEFALNHSFPPSLVPSGIDLDPDRSTQRFPPVLEFAFNHVLGNYSSSSLVVLRGGGGGCCFRRRSRPRRRPCFFFLSRDHQVEFDVGPDPFERAPVTDRVTDVVVAVACAIDPSQLVELVHDRQERLVSPQEVVSRMIQFDRHRWWWRRWRWW